MADFKETLEVTRSPKCLLSYSFCWTKEDLAELDESELPAPPMEIEFGNNATLGEVADRIEAFCDKEQKVFDAINSLMHYGYIRLVDEY